MASGAEPVVGRTGERVRLDFTVIVPTRNRSEMAVDLVRYLRSELGWDEPVIVVDQSDDGGAALARLLSAEDLNNVKHCVQEQRGTSVARNEGAVTARSSWLIFLDDDVRPAEEYLDHLRAFVEENSWVDAVQGAVEYGWEEYRQDPALWGARASRNGRQGGERDWGGLDWFLRTPKSPYSCMVVGLGSGNLAISRDVFLSAGGFDENCEGLGEDIELGLRLWWFGYRTCLCPDAVAFHLRAAFGGTRQQRRRRETLFIPDPPPSLIYFLLKWFPGRAFREAILKQMGKWIWRPWGIPFKAIRLMRSMRIAKERLRQGPKYLQAPVCRQAARSSFAAGIK